MILQTGGRSCGEPSTRSIPASRASRLASSVGPTPRCPPFSSIRRTGDNRICSLHRRFKKNHLPFLSLLRRRQRTARLVLLQQHLHKCLQAHVVELFAIPIVHVDCSRLGLLLADDRGVRNIMLPPTV